MIQGQKIFKEFIKSLATEIETNSKVAKKYKLNDIDLQSLDFDEKSDNELIELIQKLITAYQNKKGELKSRDINQLFSKK
jgi:predicted DNA-binding protein (UPF0278 family)